MSSGSDFNVNVGRGTVYFENNSNDNVDGSGITLRTSSNPVNGSIFSIRSPGNGGRFWVGANLTSSAVNDFGMCANGYGKDDLNDETIYRHLFKTNEVK